MNVKNLTTAQLIDLYTGEDTDLHTVVEAGEELARRGILGY